MTRQIGLAALAAALAFPLAAAEFFVATNGVDNTSDGWGKTEATAFLSIQAAVDAASAGDTVTLLPGDHVEGSVKVSSLLCRVNVTKTLTIRSKGRAFRDATRIVGAWDPAATSPVGMGPNAVRCVRIAAAASGTRLEGITLYRGATDFNGNAAAEKTEGGGVFVAKDVRFTAVDCAFVECQATRGGGIYNDNGNDNVQAHRCLFKRCLDTKFGAAMRGGAAYNCVFDDCSISRDAAGAEVGEVSNARDAMAYGYRAVCCTFVNGRGYGVMGGATTYTGGIYNCLFQNNNDNGIRNEDKAPAVGNNVKAAAYTSKVEVFSPYDGDYRLTCDATALGAGDAAWLDLIAEEFRGTDYCGNPRTTDGTLHAGAVQGVLDGPASGVGFKWTATGDWTLGGEPVDVAFATWRGAEGWPAPQKVGFMPAGGRALVRYSVGNSVVWPLRDDTAWVHPYKAGIAQSVGAILASPENVFWADPVNGDDEAGDGTEAAPFKTLNQAVNATNVTHVVFAKAGDYCTAEVRAGSCTNRVAVTSLSGELRVVAVDGPDVTFVTGKKGTGDSTHKTGDDAVRCIAVTSSGANYAAFQGFTLRDGHSSGTGSGAGTGTLGGALNNLTSDGGSSRGTAWLLDCVVTGCTARRGGAAAGGTLMRCRVTDCSVANGSGGGLFRHCVVVSSLVTGCGGASELFAGGATAYNVTAYGCSVSALYNGGNGAGNLRNSVLAGRTDGGWDLYGSGVTDDGVQYCLYAKASNLASGTTLPTSAKENPALLLAPDAGNCRISPLSAGVALASTEYLQSCMDIEGDPFTFTADGRYEAGCYVAKAGRTVYVDATNGDDGNDGSEEAPFATLAAAMDAAEAGGTVMALPGVYATGTMVPTLDQAGGSVTPTIAARVVVKPGVTLASRDGASATVIRGAAATGGGCGDDAVRCVFMCRNATLRGFSVTGGFTAATALSSGSDTMTVDNCGGGVCGYFAGNETSDVEFGELVENCVIYGNQALRGGGAQYGVYRNCTFMGNTLCLSKPGWALSRARAEGCVFIGNGSQTAHSVTYGCAVVNCTVYGGQANGTAAVLNEGNYRTRRAVVNTIVIAGKIDAGDNVTNCLAVAREGDAMLGPDGVPLPGSPAIDAGANDAVPADYLAGRDGKGVRRVLNSTVDIGAFEYDWGVPWGEALGGKHLTITDMPSDASFADGALFFSGGTVEMAWTGGGGALYEFGREVTGSGTLEAAANGETVGTFTAADGMASARFKSKLASNVLSFTYVPGENDVGGARLYAFSHEAGLTIILR